tara:strand:- start:114 stop:425 length:312 start_codon:yes stop_codon:yes gene_type:complete
MFELIVVGLLLTMLIGMFIISRWVIIVIINNRLINRKIEQHNLIDLELRFFRFLHFNGYEQKESSKYYLGMILENFLESKVIENEKKEKYKEIYETFIKNQKT